MSHHLVFRTLINKRHATARRRSLQMCLDCVEDSEAAINSLIMYRSVYMIKILFGVIKQAETD